MSKVLNSEFATIDTDPYVPQFQTVLTPTDEVLATRGGIAGLKVYDEIKRDPHAFAVLSKRKLEVISREWSVFPASERRRDKQAAAEVERQLKGLDFDRLTKGLMSAVLKGFSVAEILWAKDGDLWVATAVKVKKQRRFRMAVDGSLRMLTRRQSIDGEPVPDRKFIVHRHSIEDDDDDPYGVGIGSVLFWPAWFKRQVLAHWLRKAEKHATPTTVFQYEGQYDKAKETLMLAAARRMANDTAMAIPSTVDASLLEAKDGGGGAAYENLSRYLDELMSEAVLGETLSTNSGERGARSLGEIHNEVRIAIAKADSDLLSATIKNTLVRWIVELNYPGAGIPDVWRDFSQAEDLNEKVKRDKALTEMGYKPKDVSYVNDTYGGDWVEKRPEQEDKPDSRNDKQAQQAGTDEDENSVFSELEFTDPKPRSSEARGAEPRNGELVTNALTDQLETVAAPAIASMIEAIRTEFNEARDYDDLALRLARLSSEMGVDDLAGMMEQASLLASLEGVASITVPTTGRVGGDG